MIGGKSYMRAVGGTALPHAAGACYADFRRDQRSYQASSATKEEAASADSATGREAVRLTGREDDSPQPIDAGSMLPST